MKDKKLIKSAFFLLLAVGVAILAGFYREVNQQERGLFQVKLSQSQEQTEKIDIANQGMLKYYLQPGKLSFYVRSKVHSNSPAKLQVKFSGLKGYVSQGSKKSEWRELKESDILKVRNNGVIPINIEVDIPRRETMRYQVGSAVLEFVSDEQVVSKVKIDVVNSKYAER